MVSQLFVYNKYSEWITDSAALKWSMAELVK
jgi:hypothetical protein